MSKAQELLLRRTPIPPQLHQDPSEVLLIKDKVAAFKREQIVQEGIRQIFERGYENTTLDDIASSLGVRKPFIYYYIKSKQHIVDEICLRGVTAALDILKELTELQLSPPDCLRSFIEKLVLTGVERYQMIAISFREQKYLSDPASKQVVKVRRQTDEMITHLIATGVEGGYFETKDPIIATRAISGMVNWLFFWYHPDGRVGTRELSELFSELALNMLQARPSLKKSRK